MAKKIFSFLFAAIFLMETISVSYAAASTMAEKLSSVERAAYGAEQTGALIDRVNRLEKDFAGENSPRLSVMDRVDALHDLLFSNDVEPSLITRMNAVEWGISREISMESVQKRVTDMETAIEGKDGEGNYGERIEKLATYAFGSDDIPLMRIEVPVNTLVKVSLVNPINAKNLKVGDRVEIQAAEDVIENGTLLFAKGAPGYGIVEKVVQAKNFGRNAEVNIDFKMLRAIDGTDADMVLGEASKSQMKSLAMAAGASVAGMVLLGPIGVIGGAFVRGKNIDLPAGTELYIQTEKPFAIYGIRTESE